jgi:GNAT superfamily N-acetyltransferase
MQFDAQHSHYTKAFPGAEFLVIQRDDTPIGRLYVWRSAKEILVLDIALLPEARGTGIGTRLLGDLIAEGERSNLPIAIHVEKWNPARRLYDRLGFQEAGDEGVYLFMKRYPAPRGAQA